MKTNLSLRRSPFPVLLIALAIAFVGCNKDDDESAKIPPLAASAQTWTFGDQTWSDAIQIADCNKTSFTDDYVNPQCRSYTENDKTWYYYNWAYVNQNAATLCPSPWRVPSQSDFNTLVSNTNYTTLIDAWGYGGLAEGSSMDVVSTDAAYWSSTEYSGNTNYAYSLYYYIDYLSVDHGVDKYVGFQVRCVK